MEAACKKRLGAAILHKNGGAMVSTGILRQDKRGEPGNLVNCLTLKNKRQLSSCYGCLSFALRRKTWQCRDLRVTRSSAEDCDGRLNVI